jgi:hypothetical protein
VYELIGGDRVLWWRATQGDEVAGQWVVTARSHLNSRSPQADFYAADAAPTPEGIAAPWMRLSRLGRWEVEPSVRCLAGEADRADDVDAVPQTDTGEEREDGGGEGEVVAVSTSRLLLHVLGPALASFLCQIRRRPFLRLFMECSLLAGAGAIAVFVDSRGFPALALCSSLVLFARVGVQVWRRRLAGMPPRRPRVPGSPDADVIRPRSPPTLVTHGSPQALGSPFLRKAAGGSDESVAA